jgi:DMSO/TMAO reductase YedYZ molybdopterin-dependent catalytic subunit
LSLSRLIKHNKLFSWSLLLSSLTTIFLGYGLTILDIQNTLIIWGHRILGAITGILIIFHLFFSLISVPFDWKKYIHIIFEGSSDRFTQLRFSQWLSGWVLIFASVLVFLSGLDWFKIGTGWLLPFKYHISADIFLTFIIIIHSGIGLYFVLVRKSIKRFKQEQAGDGFSIARREAITALASMAITLITVIFLDRIPRINDVKEKIKGLLPPGQYEVSSLRVLNIGSVPSFNEKNWDFEVYGLVKNPFKLNYNDIRKLPRNVSISDFHCVTGWSKFGNKWEGIQFRALFEIVQPLIQANYITIECEDGYTTSLPREDLDREDVLLAYRLDDKKLPEKHGGPLRIVVPHKYGYKSGKWVRKLNFTEKQKLGYWEIRGYSNTADPFSNDRYSIARDFY